MRIFLLVLLICSEAFAKTPSDAQASISQDRLVVAIIARLQLAREVAWTKFLNHSPVADPVREAEILAVLKSEGKKIGLTDDLVGVLCIPQIEASRRVQEELIAGWKFGSPRPTTRPKDLQHEIRPLVTRVSLEMLHEWRDLTPLLLSSRFRNETEKRISENGFSSAVARIAASPLGK